MYLWIAVAAGGAIGSIARHGVNTFVQLKWPLLRFPLATLTVNVVGCCVIGILAGLVATGRLPMRTGWREFVFVGVLGGFTTFSTFGLDTVTLIRLGDGQQALLIVLLQLACGIGAVYLGLVLVERFGTVAR